MAKAIDYFSYDNKFISFKTYFSCKARKKMFDIFVKLLCPMEDDEILDLGATPDTELPDSNLFDKLYPYKSKITVASIEDCSDLVEELSLKEFVYNQPKKALPFADNQFDICFCSAVLEHVGGFEDQEFFLQECLRVANRIFITTPYRYFPLEMHTFIPFLHWLPWKTFQKIVRATKGDFWADTDNLMLCCKRDIERMNLSKTINISFVRTIGMKSNMILTVAENA
ncbi:MAG: methyltransferase domain-containing protein [Acetobacterium sp.]|nr:methyltransferase domain-containing protein [Acetobacterium sp.]